MPEGTEEKQVTGQEPTPVQNQQTQVDIDALLSKAREQEKAKLYPEIERLKGELKVKSEKLNAEILKSNGLEDIVAERDKEITRLKDLIEKAKQEGQSLGKEELEALTKERDELKAEVEKARAEFEAYKQSQEVEAYKASKLSDIDEDFKDLVTGSTKEEIDSTYAKAKALQDKVKEKYKPNLGLPTPDMNNIFESKNKDALVSVRDMDNQTYEALRKVMFGDSGNRKF